MVFCFLVFCNFCFFVFFGLAVCLSFSRNKVFFFKKMLVIYFGFTFNSHIFHSSTGRALNC
jgi:hypothetical protein